MCLGVVVVIFWVDGIVDRINDEISVVHSSSAI